MNLLEAPPIKICLEPRKAKPRVMQPKKMCSYLHSQQEHVRRIREEIEERKKILQVTKVRLELRLTKIKSLDATFTEEKQNRWQNVLPKRGQPNKV